VRVLDWHLREQARQHRWKLIPEMEDHVLLEKGHDSQPYVLIHHSIAASTIEMEGKSGPRNIA